MCHLFVFLPAYHAWFVMYPSAVRRSLSHSSWAPATWRASRMPWFQRSLQLSSGRASWWLRSQVSRAEPPYPASCPYAAALLPPRIRHSLPNQYLMSISLSLVLLQLYPLERQDGGRSHLGAHPAYGLGCGSTVVHGGGGALETCACGCLGLRQQTCT